MGLSVVTALEIAGNWPANIKIEALQGKENKKWTSRLVLFHEGFFHKCMLDFNDFPFETEHSATNAMQSVVDAALAFVNKTDHGA